MSLPQEEREPARARRYEPVSTLPSDRPQLPSQPCAACGNEVDPLRAPCALAFEDGVRVLCSEDCKQNHRSGERVRRKPATMPPASSSTPVALAAPSVAPAAPSGSARKPACHVAAKHDRGLEPLDRLTTMWLWIGAATAGTAATLASFGGPETAFASALLTCCGALAALRLTTATRSDVTWLGWLLGPLGVIGAAIATYWEARAGAGVGLDSFGAVLAAAALLVRGMIDAHARRPVQQTVQNLWRALPAEVRVPGPGLSGHDAESEALETSKLRVGEEIVVRRGERLGVDGIVQAGEASVLPYPGATEAITRRTGDAVLAGGRVVEGALRVLASRVGDDRSVARVARSGRADQRGAALLLRWTQRAMPWVATAILLGCAALLLFGTVRGGSPLAAASSILIAAPLLAIRRAAEWPLLGATTSAGARGILIQSGSALDLAGHVRTVAMAPHRTLTEGKPEVLDVITLGDDKLRDLLSLAAGAELLAGDHPIGRAIVSYADKRGITPSDMRRSIAVVGRGLTGTGPDGEEIVIGSRRLLLDQGVSVAAADAYAARAEAAGRTAVFMAVSGRVRAVFSLHDHLRSGARASVQRLFDMGLEVVLLTGDQRGPVEQLAKGFDIAHIKCELLPDERAQEVRSLREAGGPVAVIGYPAEDAAALAAADVAIVLGAAGGGNGDNAIALLSEDLRDAAATLWLARAARACVMNALRVAAIGFTAVVAGAVIGLCKPGLTASIVLLIDAYGIHAGARLLRRIALRFGSGS